MEKKTRHHYVWRHYLKPWTTSGKLWCKRGGTLFQTSRTNVAVERHYYRLKEMEEKDLRFVRSVVLEGLPPVSRQVGAAWVPLFTDLFRYKAEFQSSGSTDMEAARQLDTAINNLEEDLHAKVENDALSQLESLRSGDVEFMRDGDGLSSFCFFLAMQYMRTPTRFAAMQANLSDAPFNLDAGWGLLRTILASGFAFQMNRRGEKLRATFVQASDEGIRFITGDQPVLNAKAVGLAVGEEAKDLELLYPLGPNLALFIDFEGEGGPTRLNRQGDAEEVDRLNTMVKAEAAEQLYAAEKDDLL